MLPFLKQRNVGTITEVTTRKPDHDQEDSSDNGFQSCIDEFISATHANDKQAAAHAFRAAFEILDSEEEQSEEGQDTNDGEGTEGNE